MVGGAVGTLVGPEGTVVGAAVGGVVGAIGGGIVGSGLGNLVGDGIEHGLFG